MIKIHGKHFFVKTMHGGPQWSHTSIISVLKHNPMSTLVYLYNAVIDLCKYINSKFCCCCCQTLGLVLRLRVDFVLPLSQEEQEQEQEEQEEPLTKIYQKGVY